MNFRDSDSASTWTRGGEQGSRRMEPPQSSFDSSESWKRGPADRGIPDNSFGRVDNRQTNSGGGDLWQRGGGAAAGGPSSSRFGGGFGSGLAPVHRNIPTERPEHLRLKLEPRSAGGATSSTASRPLEERKPISDDNEESWSKTQTKSSSKPFSSTSGNLSKSSVDTKNSFAELSIEPKQVKQDKALPTQKAAATVTSDAATNKKLLREEKERKLKEEKQLQEELARQRAIDEENERTLHLASVQSSLGTFYLTWNLLLFSC